MKKIVAALFLTGILYSCSSKEEKTTVNEETVIRQLLSRTDSARQTKDTTLLNTVLSGDFLYTNPDGTTLNKEQQLVSMVTSEIKMENGNSENVQIKFYGTTAVVSGNYTGTGTYRGNALSVKEKFLQVWLKTDSSWVMVAAQDNIVK